MPRARSIFIVQQVLADNTILAIARLTDDPKKNLSVDRLPKTIANPDIAKAVKKEIGAAEPTWTAV